MIQSADFAEVCDGALGEEIHAPLKSVHLDNTDNGFLGTFLVIWANVVVLNFLSVSETYLTVFV